MAAIPILLPDACAGLAKRHGLLRDEGESLVVEYQTQDAITGLLKSDVQETRIPLKEVAAIRVRKSWLGWSDSLAIQMTSMVPVAQVPGMQQGRLTLLIHRANLPAAEELAQRLTAYLNK